MWGSRKKDQTPKPRSSIGHTPKLKDKAHQRRRGAGISALRPLLPLDFGHDDDDDDDNDSIMLEKTDSIDLSLPHLTENEATFFNLVEVGNLKRIKQFLDSDNTFNINCKNYQGLTALVTVIKNEDIDTMRYFLQYEELELGECFLHAVETGNLQIVQAFLRSCENVDSRKEIEFMACDDNSVAFTPHTTPLMQAAHQGHYEIIRYLLRRGHTIECPHSYKCVCSNCFEYVCSESLVDAMFRLNVYKAIAHPHYICQSSHDPILSAFELCTELKQLSLIDREFSKEFRELAEQCSKFAVDILDQCRNSEEVDVLLHRRHGSKRAQIKPGFRFTRVGLAIQHNQKQFVAHSSCQQALRTAWIEGFPKWKRQSIFYRLLLIIPRVLCIPFMVIMYIFAPHVKFVAKYFSSPLQKYINHTVSYVIFITLVTWQTIVDSQIDQRGPPNTGVEPAIMTFIVAFLCANIVKYISKGAKSYMEQKWNLFDLILYLTFLTLFGVWAWGNYDLQNRSHILHVPRKFWKADDPTLVGEAIYSIAIVLAFLRLTFFFQIVPGIGPLQLSFSRLFSDILKFFFIFFTVLLSFAFGLFTLYHNYEGMRRTEDGEVLRQKEAFVTIEATLSSLYWCLYGYGSPDYANIVLEAYVEKQDGETVILFNHHHLTEMVGRTLFAMYHIAAFVILLNMLIAMMTQSLEKIQENADSEWKFNRSRVWMQYLQTGGELPPPFNLLPTPKQLWSMIKWISYKCNKDPRAKFNPAVCCYLEYEEQTEEQKHQEDENFTKIMAYLVQRYLTSKDNMQEALPATMDDIESVKHYLRDLREGLELSGNINPSLQIGRESDDNLITLGQQEDILHHSDSVFLKSSSVPRK